MQSPDAHPDRGYGLLAFLLVIVAVTCVLGIWQIHRGRVKQQALRRFDQAWREPPMPWQQPERYLVSPGQQLFYKKIIVCGVYDGAHQFLLEGRGKDTGEPQYEVWTPLRLTSGYLIVSRGLVQHDRHVGLGVSGARRCIQGLLRPWPKKGFRLGPGIVDEEAWPKVAVTPTQDEVRRALGYSVYGVVVLLHPEEPDGFVRHWRMEGLGPPRHYGYAVTWFALAACALTTAIWLAARKRGDRPCSP